MILTEDNDTDNKVPVGQRAAGYNAAGPSNSREPPPPYQATTTTSSPLRTSHDYLIPLHGQRALERFWKSFIVAVIIWSIFSILVRSFVELVYWRHTRHRNGRWLDIHKYPIPEGVTLSECVSQTGWLQFVDTSNTSRMVGSSNARQYPYAAETSFNLPLSSETLSLLSRGPLSSGSVDLLTSPYQPQGVVTYRVIVNYMLEEVRNLAEVCKISRENDNHGVGIFTPTRPHFPWPFEDFKNTLYIETQVIFPESSYGYAGALVKKFVTDVPNTTQRVAEISKVTFESIDLLSSNAHIDSLSLNALNGRIRTTNGMISGVFNTSSKLELQTTNAQIRVQVGMTSLSDAEGMEPQLITQTSNGEIRAEVSLFSSSPSGTGGKYRIHGTTFNSRIGFYIPTAPISSSVIVQGATTNGLAEVVLHPTFEGDFALDTSSVFDAKVIIGKDRDNKKDPEGRGRERQVAIDLAGEGTARGRVWWEKPGEKKGGRNLKGRVQLVTSNANALLVV